MKREPQGRVDINWFSPDVNGEYKYTRKMYAQHKNMQSGGFVLGDDSIAKKYVERPAPRVDYKEEMLQRLRNPSNTDRKSVPPATHHRSGEDLPPIRENAGVQRTVHRPSPFQRVVVGRQPFDSIGRQKADESPLRAAANQALLRSVNRRSEQSMVLETSPARDVVASRSVSPYFRGAPAPRDLTPPALSRSPAKESKSISFDEITQRLLQGPRYTKRSPKPHLDNPITGAFHIGVPTDYSGTT